MKRFKLPRILPVDCLMRKVSPSPSPRSAKNRRTLLQYRSLEERRLLAVITVDTLADSLTPELDGQVSLREAITAANTNAAFGDAPAGDSETDFIQFAPSIMGQTITLDGEELEITGSVVIRGGNAGVTIDAGGQSRIFSVNTDQRVAFTSLTLTGGFAREGAAVLARGEGVVQLFSSTLVRNRATSTLSGGGAVFNLDSDLVFASSEIADNFTHGHGGGVFSVDGTVRSFNSEFRANNAVQGGAIAIVDGALFASQSNIQSNELFRDTETGDSDADAAGLVGNVISEGQADLVGGGVAFLGDSVTSVISSTTIDRNTAEVGGGIFIDEGNRVYVARDSEFSSNQALFELGSDTLEHTGGSGVYSFGLIRVTDTVFRDNYATSWPTTSGGAILSVGGNVVAHRSEFIDNKVDGDGGAISVIDGRLRVTASTFSDNGSNDRSGRPRFANPHQELAGGAINLVGSTRGLIIGSTFEDNVAFDFGGAISNSAFLQVSNSQFLRNISESRDQDTIGFEGGGAIFNDGGRLNVFASTFTGNDSTVSSFNTRNTLISATRGGAIHSNGGVLDIGASSFFSNTTDGSGGAVSITGGEATIFESTFGDENGRGNQARYTGDIFQQEVSRGGAIFVDGTSTNVPTLLIQGSTFAGNVAGTDGGALWAGVSTRVQVFASRSQATSFVSNQALARSGGGLYTLSNSMRIVDAVFSSNSSRDGGGIFADGGRLTLVRSQVTTNEARRIGDDFFNRANFFENFGSTIDDVFVA